mmetsp:Transcript_52383/g.125125  ORF Transcript_52383/g.125125 Transcript_52383/m.125125 type:complete len:806 (-) Transcript_52383:34-2451(-)
MGNVSSWCAKASIVQNEDDGETVRLDLSRSSLSRLDLGFLTSVDLFKRLPEEANLQVARICIPCTFAKDQSVVRQGDLGNEFFIIKNGTASVWIRADGADKESKVAILGPGDYFGETALLRDVPRNATVKAVTDLEVVKITRKDFFGMGLNEKLEARARRGAAVAQDNPNPAVKPPSPKTPEEEKLIGEALKKNKNLQATVALNDERVKKITSLAWKENIVAGTQLITEGDKDASFFYIIQEGAFNVVKSEAVDKDLNSLAVGLAKAQVVATISRGVSFGELALLYQAPRAATVEAATDAVVWVIDRTNFQTILQSSAEELHKTYVGYLNKVEVLKPLNEDEKLQIAKALQEMHFTKGETIIEQGEEGRDFFILYSGELTVIKDGATQATLTASDAKCQTFGERALLRKEPRAATVKVTSDEARALKLDKDTFEALVGPLAEIKEGKRRRGTATMAGDAPANPAQTEGKAKKREFGIIKRKELKSLSLLGCGGFGAVKLVQHTTTKNCYALKEVSKGFLVQQNMQVRAMREKDVQMMCDSNFIVKLYETYTDSQTLFLLLELALGGELFYTYFRKGFHGSEKHARFYVAGTGLAFEHMHERHIVYRDLKPENILLNDQGQLKITDMGLAKVVMGKTFTTCGTPEYFAPELIASTGHNQAVDWWALGILLFELMAGHTPFEASKKDKQDSDIMQIFTNIKKGIQKVTFPSHFNSNLIDLVSRLCSKEPSLRPPMRKGGLKNLKSHAWYEGFAWETLISQTMEPPYKPKVKSPTDVTHFRVSKEDMPPQIPYKDDKSGWDKGFATST